MSVYTLRKNESPRSTSKPAEVVSFGAKDVMQNVLFPAWKRRVRSSGFIGYSVPLDHWAQRKQQFVKAEE